MATNTAASETPSIPSNIVEDNSVVSMTPSASTDISMQNNRKRPLKHLLGGSVPSARMEGQATVNKTPASARTETSGHSRRQHKTSKFHYLVMPTMPYSDNPMDLVDSVLMTFDALRRRLGQLEETYPEGNQQIHLKALGIMKEAKLFVNQDKRIGGVPGVAIGDIFYFKVEMCLVGLHRNVIPGIDYMSATFGKLTSVATCIVSSDKCDDQGDPNVLIYTGSGSEDRDQKLVKDNLALMESRYTGNLIRVVRSATDLVTWQKENKKKICIYDGLYKITESWTEEGKNGFLIFKHKLVREPGQPDGITLWNKVQKWRQDLSSRDHLILPDLSDGAERTKVCVVNEVDNETAPTAFIYTTRPFTDNQVSLMRKMQSCICTGPCFPCGKNCSFLHPNGSYIPYSSAGILVSRNAMLYECNDSCACPGDCRNRQVQRGSCLHFEVFKTENRGWGLRSWDPIRAGTFICEYAGEIIEKEGLVGDDDYIFEGTRSGHNLKWNCVPELVGQPSLSDPNDTFRELSIVISAKQNGNVARFMNHSCLPNVFWQPVIYDEGPPHIAFFAVKHIPPMTELTYDYGDTRSDTRQGTNSKCRTPKNCLCASQKCRGSFG